MSEFSNSSEIDSAVPDQPNNGRSWSGLLWFVVAIVMVGGLLYAFDWLPVNFLFQANNQTQIDDSVYSGGVLKGRFSGAGELTFSDGTVYKGDFLDGIFEGDGEIVAPDLAWNFVGTFKKGNAVYGTLRDQAGNEYTGSLSDGFPNSEGELKSAGAWLYSGNWDFGVAHGEGRFVFKDGSIYQGQIENFLANGSGTYFDQSGWKYEGGFKAGLRSGKGKLTFANGEVIDGEWVDDQPK